MTNQHTDQSAANHDGEPQEAACGCGPSCQCGDNCACNATARCEPACTCAN